MGKICLAKKIFSDDCTQEEIDKAYLAIDYSNKTDLVDKYGRTISHTRSWKSLLQFSEKMLTKKIP